MRKLLSSVLTLMLLASTSFANQNSQVKSRPLSDETQILIDAEKAEEKKINVKHECDIKLQTGSIHCLYPPVCYTYGCHSITAISAFGDSIVLEDGSIWKVHPYYRNEVLFWKASDPLLIVPANSFSSPYRYLIVNQVLGTKVEVTMTYGPLINNPYSLQIMAIDYLRGEVYLNDNSRWVICDSDINHICQWMEGDYVVVGTNNSSFCSLSNILINVNMYNHVNAQPY